MWNFLRAGSGSTAVAKLEELIQGLVKISGSLPSDQIVAANSYLIWTEEAERQLLSTFQSVAIPRHLHSERYWRIRSMDSATSRPQPLIRAEIKIQETYLRDLLDPLGSAQTLHVSPLLAIRSVDHGAGHTTFTFMVA